MNRPLVIRHIVSHVANNRVTAYRLRTADARPLAQYIEHLEAENANLRGGQALAQARPAAPIDGTCGVCGSQPGELCRRESTVCEYVAA
jgi:hypothetical protein